jgi:hypothetical protein
MGLWEGLMKYTFEMGSDAMMYIESFIKIGSVIQKTHRQHGDLISLLSFFQNTGSGLKK